MVANPCLLMPGKKSRKVAMLLFERWIASQLDRPSCTVVLVGAETANRPWVIHESVKSWNLGMGVGEFEFTALRTVAADKASQVPTRLTVSRLAASYCRL
jgi:MTH538 TIR-like domain (DUF1863)